MSYISASPGPQEPGRVRDHGGPPRDLLQLAAQRHPAIVTQLPHSPPAAPEASQDAAVGHSVASRVPWRTTGIGIISLGTPIGIWAADPLFGQLAAGIETAVALTTVSTALFGSQALSERAFRLLRWIGNRPEPPAPAAPSHAP